MSRKSMFGLLIMALVAGLTVLPAVAVDTTLHDGFKVDPPSLPDPDPTKWVSGSGFEDIVGPGTLLLAPGQSITSVAPAYQFSPGSFALAKMRFALSDAFKDDQRFGLNLASLGSGGAGAFFSTVGAGDLKAFVYNSGALVWSEIVIPAAEADTDYHVLKITWVSANKVEFYVDGVLKADYVVGVDGAIPVPGPATVGLVNGGTTGDSMAVDWVFVTPKKVNLTYADFASAGGICFDLDSIDLFDWLMLPLPLPTTMVTEFTQHDGVLLASAVQTSSAIDQWVPQFILNEGREISYGGYDDFFAPTNPPHSTGVTVGGWVLGGFLPGESGLNALFLFDISIKPKKKGGGVLNLHADFTYTDYVAEPDVDITLRTNFLIHVPK